MIKEGGDWGKLTSDGMVAWEIALKYKITKVQVGHTTANRTPLPKGLSLISDSKPYILVNHELCPTSLIGNALHGKADKSSGRITLYPGLPMLHSTPCVICSLS